MKNLTKKIIATNLSMLMLLGATACGGGGTTSMVDPNVEDTKTLKIVAVERGYGVEMIKEWAKAFEKTKEGVKVNVEIVVEQSQLSTYFELGPGYSDYDIFFNPYSTAASLDNAYKDKFDGFKGHGLMDYTEFYKPKCKNGSTAYLRGLARALLKLQLRKAKITFPDGTIEKNVLLVAAGNGRFYGGGIEVTPDADPSDGYLDICIVHDVNYFKVPKILPRFLKGKHLGLKEVTYRKEKTVSIECEPESRIQVDGERMPGTPVTFRIVEKALKIRVPKTE